MNGGVMIMLCQFSFSNFRSYRDETTFDLQAVSLAEFKDSLIRSDKGNELLPVSVIYGPNGGGKSNLLAALGCVISLVTGPVYELGKNNIRFIMQQKVPCTPYLFDEGSLEEPSRFQLFFRIGLYEYRYFIVLLHNEVLTETLYRRKLGASRSAKVFERDNGKISLGPILGSKGINTEINAKMPLLSFLAINYSIPVIVEVISWFEECIIRNYANPLAEQQILLADDDLARKQFLTMMNDMGIAITGYRFDNQSNDFFLQRTLHETLYELPFSSESDGTKKLFAALPVILTALREGRLIIIDELDAKLHPKLLRYVIRLFTNPEINRYGAQLLFTSHDMSTMKNSVFRRDEIWFAALNDDCCSEIYSLSELRKENNDPINNTAAYNKQYLEGRYGADPYLRNMLSWEV
jgi:AAA15 family ATPase/GTPase